MSYLWLRTHQDKAGGTHSDLADFVKYIKQGAWSYTIDGLLWNIVVPLVVGWVAQYIIQIAWKARKRGKGN
jgi:hypothetical protein